MTPQDFTDRCIWPDHDPREDELTPEDEEEEEMAEEICDGCLRLTQRIIRLGDPMEIEVPSRIGLTTVQKVCSECYRIVKRGRVVPKIVPLPNEET